MLWAVYRPMIEISVSLNRISSFVIFSEIMLKLITSIYLVLKSKKSLLWAYLFFFMGFNCKEDKFPIQTEFFEDKFVIFHKPVFTYEDNVIIQWKKFYIRSVSFKYMGVEAYYFKVLINQIFTLQRASIWVTNSSRGKI